MIRMFIIKGIDAVVTTYDKTSNGWSKKEFSKDNPYSDELLELTKESLTEYLSNMLGVDIDFKHIYTQDDIVSVSIIENGDGYPDKDGLFLVEYIFKVSMISSINIDDLLQEGND